MGRLLGPDANSRLVYTPGPDTLLSAAGKLAVVYAASTGSTLADILTYDGTSTPGAPIANSTLAVDNDSLLPQFWFPANKDTVYIEAAGGTRTAVYADSDIRLDRISGGVSSPMITTGIMSGGEVNVNGTNPKAIDIAPLVGYIVDTISSPASPTVERVETTTTTTVVLDAAAQTRVVTWFLMDSTGAVTQQASRPTNTQRRTHLQIGAISYNTVSGTIFTDQTLQVIQGQAINQLYDLLYALGPFSVSGNEISANGVNLNINRNAGVLFTPSFNHFAASVLTNDPHVSNTSAQAPATFRHATRSSSEFVATTTILDVGNYDVGGVITPVGGGANQATIFRVFLVPNNAAGDQVYIQYGQATYASLADAHAAIHVENFTTNPSFDGTAALVCYIVAIRTATNLSDPLQALFHVAGKFERP